MERFRINTIIACAMLTLGLISLAASASSASSTLTFIGLGLTFWGAILLFITPTKHVKLELLNATTRSIPTYIEKVLADAKLKGKGIYLPPKYLKDFESTQIFIPLKANQPLPKLGETAVGLFLTPPGLALSKLFEKTLCLAFCRAFFLPPSFLILSRRAYLAMIVY